MIIYVIRTRTTSHDAFGKIAPKYASTISDRLQVWTRRLCQGVNEGLVGVTAGLGEKLGEKWETNAEI